MYRLTGCGELRNRAPQIAINWFNTLSFSRSTHSVPFVTNITAEDISGSQPAEVRNLVQGKWTRSSNWSTILDPLNGESFIKVDEVDERGIQPFVESLYKCPKHGLHDPFKSPERYLMFGTYLQK